MWKNKTISVILPTYREKNSIRFIINDLFNSGYVDEVVVVNNNAEDGTDEEVMKTKARLVYEKKQGYGYAIQKGFKEVKSDIIIICEPDATFEGKDVIKLLAYSDDFSVIFGTRTTKELIWKGANMGFFLRWGNWAVAKMIEFLFNTPILTDVGCAMKLFSREALLRIQDQFTVGGEHFSPELIILTIINNLRFFEIPVNYKRRVGKSAATGNKVAAFFLGLRMIKLILKYRIRTLFKRK